MMRKADGATDRIQDKKDVDAAIQDPMHHLHAKAEAVIEIVINTVTDIENAPRGDRLFHSLRWATHRGRLRA